MAPDDIGAASPASINPTDREGFERFTRRLIGLARRHLDERLQHKIDPEDVVQSAYKSLYIRYGDELFSTAMTCTKVRLRIIQRRPDQAASS